MPDKEHALMKWVCYKGLSYNEFRHFIIQLNEINTIRIEIYRFAGLHHAVVAVE